MRFAAELLRSETKRRASNEWQGKLSKIGPWLQAADWLEDQEDDNDTLAIALRAMNMRHHPEADNGWEASSDHVKTLWRARARQLREELAKVR
jgi:hypothetical protein